MTTPFRILVTGSRDWADPDAIHDALDIAAFSARDNGFTGVTVVHGCAKGADSMADGWVRDRQRRRWPVQVERYPADWSRLGRRAGFVRNAAMVKTGADLCLAWIFNGSRGATGCADLAEGAGIHVQRFHASTAVPMPDHDETDAFIAAEMAAIHSPTAEEAHS